MSAALGLVEFDRSLHPQLRAFADAVGLPALRNLAFVEHYYLGQDFSRLFLALEAQRCVGIIGVDRLRFAAAAGKVDMAFATNFYSLAPGVGGMLWLKWMKMGELGLVFGGSEDTHRILRGRNFTYYPGVHLYRLNARFQAYAGEPRWRHALKAGLRPWARRPLSQYASAGFLRRFAGVEIEEREQFTPDLLPPSSPFSLRWAPTLEYLQWRYPLSRAASYVRYRLFAIRAAGQSLGYCVLNDGPQAMVVSHADGSDWRELAGGMLKAIFAAGESGEPRRPVTLAASHPGMQAEFCRAGFRLAEANYPFAAGSLRPRAALPDPQGWLVSLGVGDNDLRTHLFWPQHSPPPVPA